MDRKYFFRYLFLISLKLSTFTFLLIGLKLKLSLSLTPASVSTFRVLRLYLLEKKTGYNFHNSKIYYYKTLKQTDFQKIFHIKIPQVCSIIHFLTYNF